MTAFALLVLNVLLFLALLALLFWGFRWLAPKIGLPAEATNIFIVIVVLFMIIYFLKQGFPF